MEKELAEIVGDSNVLVGEGGDSHELEPRAANYIVDGVKPKAVVFPATVEEVAALVKLASARNLAVVPAGYGAGLALGNPPERLDIAISTIRMQRILDYEPADLTAGVEAGCTLQSFNEVAGKQRQWLPFDPPEANRATLGAIAATDDFGPLRYGYGLPHDYVIGIEVVQADGRAVTAGGRVVKNVTGYDLNKLFVGSFGTLGVIVRVHFKLSPLPEAEALAVVQSMDEETLFRCARVILASELVPAAIVVANEPAARQIGVGARHAALLVRFLETEPAIRYQFGRLKDILHECRLELVEIGEGQRPVLWSALTDFHKVSTVDLSLRLAVLPAHTREIFTTCERQLGEVVTEAYLLAQVGSGIVKASGRIRWEMESVITLTARVLNELRAACCRWGGSMVIERVPLEMKQQIDIWGDARSSVELMRAIKRQFDPQRIFNPGRFVAGI